jgi:hypothetical protein
MRLTFPRYLIPLTIGPAFLTGSIYLCLSRLIIAYGQKNSRFSPRVYTITFISCDFISLVLQGAGGGLSATANTTAGSNTGRYIMIAGLVSQVVSLGIFMLLWAEFNWRLRKSQERNNDFALVAEKSKFKWFQYGMPHDHYVQVLILTYSSIVVCNHSHFHSFRISYR